MESRGPEDSKNVKTSQAYFFEGFISFFEDFSLTTKTHILSSTYQVLLIFLIVENLFYTMSVKFLCKLCIVIVRA